MSATSTSVQQHHAEGVIPNAQALVEQIEPGVTRTQEDTNEQSPNAKSCGIVMLKQG